MDTKYEREDHSSVPYNINFIPNYCPTISAPEWISFSLSNLDSLTQATVRSALEEKRFNLPGTLRFQKVFKQQIIG